MNKEIPKWGIGDLLESKTRPNRFVVILDVQERYEKWTYLIGNVYIEETDEYIDYIRESGHDGWIEVSLMHHDNNKLFKVGKIPALATEKIVIIKKL